MRSTVPPDRWNSIVTKSFRYTDVPPGYTVSVVSSPLKIFFINSFPRVSSKVSIRHRITSCESC